MNAEGSIMTLDVSTFPSDDAEGSIMTVDVSTFPSDDAAYGQPFYVTLYNNNLIHFRRQTLNSNQSWIPLPKKADDRRALVVGTLGSTAFMENDKTEPCQILFVDEEPETIPVPEKKWLKLPKTGAITDLLEELIGLQVEFECAIAEKVELVKATVINIHKAHAHIPGTNDHTEVVAKELSYMDFNGWVRKVSVDSILGVNIVDPLGLAAFQISLSKSRGRYQNESVIESKVSKFSRKSYPHALSTSLGKFHRIELSHVDFCPNNDWKFDYRIIAPESLNEEETMVSVQLFGKVANRTDEESKY